MTTTEQLMTKEIEAMYEHGIIRPVKPLELPEGSRLDVILITHDKDFGSPHVSHMPTKEHAGVILVKIVPKNFEGIKSSITRLLTEKPSPNLFSNNLFIAIHFISNKCFNSWSRTFSFLESPLPLLEVVFL